MLRVVIGISNCLPCSAYQQGEVNLATQEQPAYLQELLELVFEQFRCVVHSHNVIIRNLKRIKTSRKYNYSQLALYDITEVSMLSMFSSLLSWVWF